MTSSRLVAGSVGDLTCWSGDHAELHYPELWDPFTEQEVHHFFQSGLPTEAWLVWLGGPTAHPYLWLTDTSQPGSVSVWSCMFSFLKLKISCEALSLSTTHSQIQTSSDFILTHRHTDTHTDLFRPRKTQTSRARRPSRSSSTADIFLLDPESTNCRKLCRSHGASCFHHQNKSPSVCTAPPWRYGTWRWCDLLWRRSSSASFCPPVNHTPGENPAHPETTQSYCETESDTFLRDGFPVKTKNTVKSNISCETAQQTNCKNSPTNKL